MIESRRYVRDKTKGTIGYTEKIPVCLGDTKQNMVGAFDMADCLVGAQADHTRAAAVLRNLPSIVDMMTPEARERVKTQLVWHT